MTSDVDAYLARLPDDQRMALAAPRATLRDLLPDHIECLSYAMPGFRAPGPKGKMVTGYAAFSRHLGLYPHSGKIIPALLPDCAGFRTSKSGILFTPARPRRRHLSPASSVPVRPRSRPSDPLPFHLGPNIPAGGSPPLHPQVP